MLVLLQNAKESTENLYVVNRTEEGVRKLERLEGELAIARALIRDAINAGPNDTEAIQNSYYVPQGNIYRKAYVFHRYYELYLYILFNLMKISKRYPQIYV